MKGILGRKIGMTQVFATNGELVPVTVIQVEKNVVLQKKTVETDGYNAIQLGFEDKPAKVSGSAQKGYARGYANKAETGHASKAGTAPKRYIREIRDFDLDLEVGAEVKPADVFAVGEIVDVTGTSKGKGFQGAIKRHGQSRGPMSHGSRYHRRPGSMGAVAANRVFKGKKLPGQMGGKTITVQNLEIINIDTENNVVLVRGNVPGPKRSVVTLKANVKGKQAKESKNLVNYNQTVETVESTESAE